MSLLVASHLTYCPACRDKAARLEALGGALLAEASAVAPGPRCLEKALARIAAAEAAEPERRGAPMRRCRARSAAGWRCGSATCAGGRCGLGSPSAGSTALRPSGSG